MKAANPHMPSVMDAQERPLADLYAGAVLANLPSDESAEAAAGELADLVRLLDETPVLAYVFFQAPISLAVRCALIEKAFHDRCSPVMHSLLNVLARRDRLILLPVIARRFRALLDRRQGKVEVTVTTSFAMDQTLLREVADAMARKLGVRPALRTRVDPDMVGGMVMSVGGRVYDDSIQAELAQMREAVAAGFARPAKRQAPRGVSGSGSGTEGITT